jgi:threonine synthase
LIELKELGWIKDTDKLPRLVSVQSTGCAPIVKAWEEKKTESEFWENARTLAFGITVPKALGDFLVLDAIYQTDGCAVAVDDEDILEAEALLGSREGTFVCPEGAATLSAAIKLEKEGWIKPNERVVLLNTGSGLKYPETVQTKPYLLNPGDILPRE